MAQPILRSGILGGTVDSRVGSALGIDIQLVPSPLILVKDFATLGADVSSFREPLKRAIQKVLIPSFKLNFQVGGRPPWEQLSPATQQRKVEGTGPRGGQSGRIGRGPGGESKPAVSYNPLIWTGALRRTAGQLNIWTIDRDRAYIADLPQSVWYGKVHQLGRVGFDYILPARPFLVIQEEDMNEIEEVFFDWIEERVRANGFRAGAY